MINALIDTNVVLDSLANRVPFNKESDAIFDLIIEGKINGYITASSVTDLSRRYFAKQQRLLIFS